jgi:chromosome segregation ATPase
MPPHLFRRASDVCLNGPTAVGKTRSSIDDRGRIWPVVPVPIDRVSVSEQKLADQTTELNLRNAQIADLCNVRQQLQNELIDGCEQVERLSRLVVDLQESVHQKDAEISAAAEKIIGLTIENDTLKSRLDESLAESADLSKRSLDVEQDLQALTKAHRQLQDELASAQEQHESKCNEAADLAEKLETEIRRNRDECDQQKRVFEAELQECKATILVRDIQLQDLRRKTQELLERSEVLEDKIGSLEATQRHASGKLHAQSEQCMTLETLLKIERSSAEATIKDLTVELDRLRQEYSAVARVSDTLRANILLLLPKLATRSGPEELKGQTVEDYTTAA